MWNTEVEGFLESIAYVLGDLESFKVIIAKVYDDSLEYTLGELIPLAFTGKDLEE